MVTMKSSVKELPYGGDIEQRRNYRRSRTMIICYIFGLLISACLIMRWSNQVCTAVSVSCIKGHLSNVSDATAGWPIRLRHHALDSR